MGELIPKGSSCPFALKLLGGGLQSEPQCGSVHV